MQKFSALIDYFKPTYPLKKKRSLAVNVMLTNKFTRITEHAYPR